MDYYQEIKQLFQSAIDAENLLDAENIQQTKLTRIRLNRIDERLSDIEEDILNDIEDPELRQVVLSLYEESDNQGKEAFLNEMGKVDKRYKQSPDPWEPVEMGATLESSDSNNWDGQGLLPWS